MRYFIILSANDSVIIRKSVDDPVVGDDDMILGSLNSIDALTSYANLYRGHRVWGALAIAVDAYLAAA